MGLKLSTKLYCGFFLIPAAILLAIGGYSLYAFNQLHRQVAVIYDDNLFHLKTLKSISDDYGIKIIDAVNKANAGLLTSELALASVNQAQQDIDQSWQAFNQVSLSQEEEKLVAEIEPLLNAANEEINRLEQAFASGNKARWSAFDGSLYTVIDPVTNKIQELIEQQLKDGALEREKADAIYRRTLWLFSLLVLLAILVASPIGYFFSRSIAKTLRETIQQVLDSSSQIAIVTEQQEQTIAQQAAAVNQTTATMDELSASSQSTAEQAESAAIGARHALTLAESGSQAVAMTLTGMRDLQDKVEAIAQQIIRLSEQTNQIGSISQLVSSLANQTNMLALNAAVEAVRAGDHGKGFSVVAAEIRKLSDESQKSAQRINILVSDIQSAINSTVMVTEEGTKTVQSGVAMSQQTSNAFAGVAEAVNNVVISNQQISLNVKQQAIAIGQVLEAMGALNQGAAETANGISQTRLGVQQLNQVASELQSTV
ncbi:MAG: HAMP domain-containing methyl-accepting chemotaxis protein [Microcoleaceae cyanobacterium]